MTVTIRRLLPGEWPAFRALRLRALASDPGNFFRTVAEEKARPVEHWREMLESDDGAVFGLFDGARLVGLTAVYVDRAVPARDTAGLGMTWLEPAYLGRGLAALIYAERIAWARAKGMARIAVSHRASNAASGAAMRRAGFVAAGRTPHRWPDGAEEDNVTYEMVLRAAPGPS